MDAVPAAVALPLAVDLDGTLVRGDTLAEAALGAVARGAAPTAALALLREGRAGFKRRLAASAPPQAALLPYNETLLAYLRRQKEAGRRLILATAADRAVAEAVAAELGLFDEVIASDGHTNLKGAAKAEALAARFGPGGFAYAGDSRADLPVWERAGAAVLVNAAPSVADRVRVPIELRLEDRPALAPALWRAMRPYQWVKNLLVLVPLFTAHAYGDARAWRGTALAFWAFCAVASAFYLVNDLLDLPADRAHRRKRLRAFASGAAPVAAGIMLAVVLLALGAGLAFAAGAARDVALYAALTLAYSLRLKEMPLVDVFALAALYTLRLFGGGEAAGHPVSLWLLGFSSFLFLSLALLKRVEELRGGEVPPRRRGYQTADAAILQVFGCASSFAACIVLALFVQNEVTTGHYASPALLWGMVPLFLFWQCRLWLSTARGYMHDDPIVYAARDWVSWIVGLLLVALTLLAHWVAWLPGTGT
ncbi:MAG: UbiA family prenyltransferase [Rhodospirillales bacterium]|nr:UbiA family prenyltransferase [Rhodospirillales bacterium]